MAKCLVVTVISAILCWRASSQSQLQQETFKCGYWSFYDEETNTCVCDSPLFGIVFCKTSGTEVEVSVVNGYCMTLNNNENEAVVGACPYRQPPSSPNTSCHVPGTRVISRNLCASFRRAGQLCGKCANGSALAAYSYYMQCFECSSGTSNWLKYFAVSLLPTTAFLFVIIIFRFRANSPQVNGYIFTCQVFTLPIVMRSILHSPSYNSESFYPTVDLYLSILSVWNLDFFRVFYAPFCLHPNISTLQMLCLDYIIAVYPLLLIITTYILARLHYNNCRLVVWLWRPFIGCFARCSRQWDIQNSLVDAFVTFLLLSYVKFFSVSEKKDQLKCCCFRIATKSNDNLPHLKSS